MRSVSWRPRSFTVGCVISGLAGALLLAPARRLGGVDLSVVIGVDVAPDLESRDLGHVGDEVDADHTGRDVQLAELIDREVAERMG